MEEQQGVSQVDTNLNHVLEARRDELVKLRTAGEDPSQITKCDVTAHSMGIEGSYEQWEGKKAAIAGHMTFKHVMDKASLCGAQDLKGNIQVYVAEDSVGEESYKDFERMDIGDIVGVKETVFTTETGEISIYVTEVTPLSKSPRVLSKKFHGLTDMDMRYRQHYVDLIMNAEVKDTFIKCSRIPVAIHKYLDGEGFTKVEIPMLVSSVGGAAVRPFETHLNALDEDLKLRILLEFCLERLIVGGLERVYETGHVFHNGSLDTRHNSEFTLMELYQAYMDYNGMTDLTEKLYCFVAQGALGTTTITYKGVEMGLGKPFTRVIVVDAVKKYAGVDFDQIHTLEEVRAVVKERGVEFEERRKKGDILNLFFEEFVEEHLVQSTLVPDHPMGVSPLIKREPGNPDHMERFKFFMNGWEMADAYSEISNPTDQREWFGAQEELLIQGNEEANHTDENFLNALEMGIPPTGGIGFSIDRMVTLLTDSPAIRGMLLFLTMKSLGGSGGSKKADMASAWTATEAGSTTEKAQIIQERIDFSKVKIEPPFEKMIDFDTFVKSDYRAVKIKGCMAVPRSRKLLQFTPDNGSGTDRTTLSGIHEYYGPEELIGKAAIVIVNLPPRKMMGIDSCGTLISAVHEEDGKEGLNLLMVNGRIPAGTKLC